MPDRDQPATMTVEQAGKLLGISRGLAYRAVSDGTIPAIRIGGRIIVPTAALLRLLGSTGTDSNGVVPDPSTSGDSHDRDAGIRDGAVAPGPGEEPGG